MKRMLINATHAEEIRVALVTNNRLYDFDLENRTREQKKSNIYKGHITRVEPSLEAVFVEYGAGRQGFLSLREIAPNYLNGDPRNNSNMRELISEGTELLVQVEKEERGNKGAALSTYISLAGRYLVLMPNNPKGGGISRQISGSMREELKETLSALVVPRGMSVIARTAGIGRSKEELQMDLQNLLDLWTQIQQTAQGGRSPMLVHQEAGVVTRAIRDYLRDDVAEILIDNENAYNEAYHFIKAVMPHQLDKLKTYTLDEPLFAHFGVETQIQTAYEREVKLPSGGSIVIDQTEALVAIDINSAKSTRGGDVEETAYHTNLEAAEEIARQLRLRDMGGLIVIDFIDMGKERNQRAVEARLREATQSDRARIQFGQLSRFGLMEMSRQRLRPSLEESTGYMCPRCHGTGMVRDLRSLSLSIMRRVEEIALQQRHGEVQIEVPVEIAAFMLNEKRHSLVYLEQTSGVRITVLPHPHLETPHYHIDFNSEGFAPASYDRTAATRSAEQELGYEISGWHMDEAVTDAGSVTTSFDAPKSDATEAPVARPVASSAPVAQATAPQKAVTGSTYAWLENLFVQKQAHTSNTTHKSQDAAAAIEALVNGGAVSRGQFGHIAQPVTPSVNPVAPTTAPSALPEANGYLSASTAPAAPTRPQSSGQSRDRDERRKDKDKDKDKNRNREGRNDRQDQRDNRADQARQSARVEPRPMMDPELGAIDPATVISEPRMDQRNDQRNDQAVEKRREDRQDRRSRDRDRDRQPRPEHNADQPAVQGVPRRDRNQQRAARPPRQRDEAALQQYDVSVQMAAVPQPVTPATATLIDVTQGEYHTLELAQATQETLPVASAAPVVQATEPVQIAEPVQQSASSATPLTAPAESAAPTAEPKRAANDPRQRRGQSGASASLLNSATLALLREHTVGSLIRQVYGEDCGVLLEQFGLVTIFNRALGKYLAEQQPVIDTPPVTRDAVLPERSASAEPVEPLPLTPPASSVRVANDPRQRRRAAMQAQLAQSMTDSQQPEISTEDRAQSSSQIQPEAEVVSSVEQPVTSDILTPVTESDSPAAHSDDLAVPGESSSIADQPRSTDSVQPGPEDTQSIQTTESPVVTDQLTEEHQSSESVEGSEPEPLNESLNDGADDDSQTGTESSHDEHQPVEEKVTRAPRRPRGRPPKKSGPAA